MSQSQTTCSTRHTLKPPLGEVVRLCSLQLGSVKALTSNIDSMEHQTAKCLCSGVFLYPTGKRALARPHPSSCQSKRFGMTRVRRRARARAQHRRTLRRRSSRRLSLGGDYGPLLKSNGFEEAAVRKQTGAIQASLGGKARGSARFSTTLICVCLFALLKGSPRSLLMVLTKLIEKWLQILSCVIIGVCVCVSGCWCQRMCASKSGEGLLCGSVTWFVTLPAAQFGSCGTVC